MPSYINFWSAFQFLWTHIDWHRHRWTKTPIIKHTRYPPRLSSVGRHRSCVPSWRTCLVKRSRNQFGDRCFAIAGPTLWNSLNSFGNRTSLSENSNDRWKRLCLVSWSAAPCVWTL